MHTTSAGARNDEIACSHTTVWNKNDRNATSRNDYTIFTDTNTIDSRVSWVDEQAITGEIEGAIKVAVTGIMSVYTYDMTLNLKNKDSTYRAPMPTKNSATIS